MVNNMAENKAKEMYKELFPDEKSKAETFDKIAENYYMCNFGEMPKSELELLLFSEYLDKILEKHEEDMFEYSDYKLSKYLGITQRRISSLKEKKQLKYPAAEFDWKKSFERIIQYVRYENEKILINIPDRNLYLEIKNAIEEGGGYVDVQLNPSLLKIPIDTFFDFLLLLDNESNNKKEIVKIIRKRIEKENKNINLVENGSISMQLKKAGIGIGKELFEILLGDISKSVNLIGTGKKLVEGVLEYVHAK